MQFLNIDIGINYIKLWIQKLINKINSREVSKIDILYNDMIIRSGFELIEYFCKLNNVEIEIIDKTTTSKEVELTNDLIQIITVFTNRI